MARADSSPSVRRPAYITNDRVSSIEEALHRRRKSAMVALLGQFEELIEPLIPSGNAEAIATFKGVCREKINGLAYTGIQAAKARAGESISRQTADLAERLAFDPND
jgi:hypothetical protein